VAAYRARQHAAFDIAALADEIVGRIAVADALDVLLTDQICRQGSLQSGASASLCANARQLLLHFPQ
jgi:hypothetical protein